MALGGQVLSCLAHRDARPAGGGADAGDRREQRVLPQVVGLPPGDLIQQVRFGPAMEAAAASTAYWSLVFCRPRQVHSGRHRSRPSRGSGSARLAPHQSSASAATRRNTSPGKVLSRGCSGASPLTSSKRSASRASPSSRTPAGGHGVLRCKPLPGRHIPTVGQNHRSPGGLTGGCRDSDNRCSAVTLPVTLRRCLMSCVTHVNRPGSGTSVSVTRCVQNGPL
jgi:hypothetical protein